MKFSFEDIYNRLSIIMKQVDIKREDSFDNKKVFKYLYNAVLDLIDELEYVKTSDELFDDEEDFLEEEERFVNSDPENSKKDSWNILDDLIDD